mmetsp:Transcript_6799/g.10978  ORF Transcript_6799/g.10978 Transcript_6799/m.10978 type:complete len:94 (+) Transcript_6799:251-532(+)
MWSCIAFHEVPSGIPPIHTRHAWSFGRFLLKPFLPFPLPLDHDGLDHDDVHDDFPQPLPFPEDQFPPPLPFCCFHFQSGSQTMVKEMEEGCVK